MIQRLLQADNLQQCTKQFVYCTKNTTQSPTNKISTMLNLCNCFLCSASTCARIESTLNDVLQGINSRHYWQYNKNTSSTNCSLECMYTLKTMVNRKTRILAFNINSIPIAKGCRTVKMWPQQSGCTDENNTASWITAKTGKMILLTTKQIFIKKTTL